MDFNWIIIILCSVVSFVIGLVPACRNWTKEIIVEIVESRFFLLLFIGISFGALFLIDKIHYYVSGIFVGLIGFILALVALPAIIYMTLGYLVLVIIFFILNIWIPEGIILKLWLPALIFFLPALPKAFEEANLVLEVERRKKQAISRCIIKKAEKVVNLLGDGNSYEDEGIQISCQDNNETFRISDTNSNPVFIGIQIKHPGYFYRGDTYYEREEDDLGHVRYVKGREEKYSAPYTEHRIESYIPSLWEDHLENLHLKALKQEEINAEMKSKEGERKGEDLKKRFGLDG